MVAVWRQFALGEEPGRDSRVHELPYVWLRSFAQERLLTPPHKGSSCPPPDAVAAVTAQESDIYLVSFVWAREEGKALEFRSRASNLAA